MLGRGERYAWAPFFWSAHYEQTIGYIGHAERWDDVRVDGDLAAGNASVTYRAGGRVLAVATIGRDRLGLEVAEAMERGDDAALERALQA